MARGDVTLEGSDHQRFSVAGFEDRKGAVGQGMEVASRNPEEANGSSLRVLRKEHSPANI